MNEPLVDSLLTILDGRRYDKDLMAPMRDGYRGRLIETLASDDDPTRYGHGIPQKLTLMNSNLMGYRKKVVVQAVEGKLPWEKALDLIYLGVLARRPEPDEVALFTRYRDARANTVRDQLYDQIAWTLINTSEFLFNH